MELVIDRGGWLCYGSFRGVLVNEVWTEGERESRECGSRRVIILLYAKFYCTFDLVSEFLRYRARY